MFNQFESFFKAPLRGNSQCRLQKLFPYFLKPLEVLIGARWGSTEVGFDGFSALNGIDSNLLLLLVKFPCLSIEHILNRMPAARR